MYAGPGWLHSCGQSGAGKHPVNHTLVCPWILCPEGATAYQPRATPWVIRPHNLQPEPTNGRQAASQAAAKRQRLPHSLCEYGPDVGSMQSPFRAKHTNCAIPRAVPWAGMPPRLQRSRSRTCGWPNVYRRGRTGPTAPGLYAIWSDAAERTGGGMVHEHDKTDRTDSVRLIDDGHRGPRPGIGGALFVRGRSGFDCPGLQWARQ